MTPILAIAPSSMRDQEEAKSKACGCAGSRSKLNEQAASSVHDLKSKGEVKQPTSVQGCHLESPRRLSDFFLTRVIDNPYLRKGRNIGAVTIITDMKGGKRMCVTLGSF